LAHFLKIYQQRLTNLTARNRSLVLLRLAVRQFFDLHALDFVANRPSFGVIEDLLGQKRRIGLGRTADSRHPATNRASLALGQLARTDQTVQEERGANDLYVGYPFVQGRLHDDSPVRCPLLFFPVELGQEGADWVLRPRPDEAVAFNQTFLLAYAHYNQVRGAEALAEFSFEQFSRDPQVFLTELYRMLEASLLEINFNPDTFAGRLQTFQPYTKADFAASTRTGELRLVPEAVLGLFPQADSYLAPDYDGLLARPDLQTAEDFFPELPPQPAPSATGEAQLVTPYDLDASQERVLRAVKAGASVVVQGPPGTGKSQLICNLVADQMAAGRRVLVVCQKRAALDVVEARLRQKGLDRFAALLHDFQHDRARIYAQVAAQIDAVHERESQKIDLSSLQFEEKFIQCCREIEAQAHQLDEFRQALFDASACGVSAKTLYLTSSPGRPWVDLGGLHRHFQPGDLGGFMGKLRAHVAYAARLDTPAHPWHARVGFQAFQFADCPAMVQAMHQVAAGRLPLAEKLAGIFGQNPAEIAPQLTVAALQSVLAKAQELAKCRQLLAEPGVWDYFQRILPFAEVDLRWFGKTEKQLLACFNGEGVEHVLAYHELEIYTGFLQEYLAAQPHFFSRLRWSWFAKSKRDTLKLFAYHALEPSEKSAKILLAKIARRQKLEGLKHQLLSTEWLAEAEGGEFDTKAHALEWVLQLPTEPEKPAFERWFRAFRTAVEAKRAWQKLGSGPWQWASQADLATFDAQLGQLLGLAGEFAEQYRGWQKYLSPTQIGPLWQGEADLPALEASLLGDFELMAEHDRLRHGLTPPEAGAIDRLGPGLDPDVAADLFDNSLRLAWLADLERQHPVLRRASSLGLAQAERDLQKAVRQKAELARQIALARAWERLLADLDYNRLSNLVSYRDLRHQVNKKRGVWPLRKVVAQFADELFKLVPCWLASPESVSAIFPMTELFDLVIFDEASQCFAERGIPAMYRGRQVVVAGDQHQLAPFDLYRPRWEELADPEQYTPELEVESLLDLGSRYLPTYPLTGHYRSRSLDLIDFSNQHFYQNGLRMLPDYREFVRQQPAIEYRKVDGTWAQNTNEAEAAEVVRLVAQALAEDPHRHLGVITFNHQQQELIRDRLDEAGLALPEHFFVKNIENVQGDERDLIIFSVGYAPSANGRLYLQFGSLSQAKGENRLNVAVTRARERVVVVCSLWPHQLAVDDTAHPGPKLLRAYLQYALDVSERRYQPSLPPAPAHLPDGYLKHQLLAHQPGGGLVWQTDLPFADVSVVEGGVYQKIILTDDDLFFRAWSAKDAHAYLPALLEQKNWTYLRAYSRNWWAKRAEELDRLRGK
jgi:DNA polymerase IIIc chi subunit